MRFVLPTVGSAAIAALISVASLAGPAGVMLVALALVILLAAGWPQLLRLAAPAGSSVVVGACGAAAVLVVGLTAQRSLSWAHNLTWLTPVLAMSVIAAFLHQLTRTDGRAHLVESVTGVVSGIMVAAMAAGWAATAARPGGSAVMLAVTCPMTVVALVLALAAWQPVTAVPAERSPTSSPRWWVERDVRLMRCPSRFPRTCPARCSRWPG